LRHPVGAKFKITQIRDNRKLLPILLGINEIHPGLKNFSSEAISLRRGGA
jgi:hypothetical protein